jgi:hypothetical protein
MRKVWSSLMMLGASVFFLSGCGQQELTQLKPTTEKQRIAIVYESDASTMQSVHAMVQDQLHTSKNTFEDFGYSTIAQVDEAYRKAAESKQYKLIVTNASASAVQNAVGQTSQTTRTAWIPDLSTVLNNTNGSMTRPAVQLNTADIAFVDGYLAGRLQNRTRLSIVLPDLQGSRLQLAKWVESGIYAAGFKGTVTILDLSKSVPTENPASIKPKTPIDLATRAASILPGLDSQVLIFPVPVDDKVIQAAYGKSVILGFPSSNQFGGIIADIMPAFAESVQDLIQAWDQGKWQPGQTLTIFPESVVRVRNSAVIDRSTQEAVQTISRSIANQSYTPKLDSALP